MGFYLEGAKVIKPFQKTTTTLMVLAAIDVTQQESDEFHGYWVTKYTGLLSSRVYPILHRLQRVGVLTSRLEQASSKKRYYRLTTDGREYIASHRQFIGEQVGDGKREVAHWPVVSSEGFKSYGLRMTMPFLKICEAMIHAGSEEFYGVALATASGVSRHAVYQALRRMQAKGLLALKANQARSWGMESTRIYYELTPAGYEFLEGVKDLIRRRIT